MKSLSVFVASVLITIALAESVSHYGMYVDINEHMNILRNSKHISSLLLKGINFHQITLSRSNLLSSPGTDTERRKPDSVRLGDL